MDSGIQHGENEEKKYGENRSTHFFAAAQVNSYSFSYACKLKLGVRRRIVSPQVSISSVIFLLFSILVDSHITIIAGQL